MSGTVQDQTRRSGDTAGEVVLDYLRTQAATLRRLDPQVREDVPDSIHRMRVAARRMRSALQTFGRVLDREHTGRLVDELRWVAGELAEARDAEVMAERLRSGLAELPDAANVGSVAAELDREFARREAEGKRRALDALNGPRYAALWARIDELLDDPPLTWRARSPARRELRKALRRSYRRMTERLAVAITLPPGARRDEALHEARKAAKRLRYAVELAEPAIGKPVARLRPKLAEAQSVLGEHQDTVVARPVLRELATRAGQDGSSGFTYGLLYAAERERARRAEADLLTVWARLRKPKYTGWLRG